MRQAKFSYIEFCETIGETDTANRAKLTEKPEVQHIRAVMHEGKLKRAQIQAIDLNGNCSLSLIDYGEMVDGVHWRELRSLSYKQRSVPRLTHKVHLEGIAYDAEGGGRFDEFYENAMSAEERFKVVNLEKRKNPIHGKSLLVQLQRSNGAMVNDEVRKVTNTPHIEEVDDWDEDDEDEDMDFINECDKWEIVDDASSSGME